MCALGFLVAGTSAAALSRTASPALSPPEPTWLIGASAIGFINGYLGNSTLTANAFDTSSTIEVDPVAPGWSSQGLDVFDAYGPVSNASSLLYALQNRTIPAGTQYLMYDDENWSFTPTNEQQDPSAYMAAFVTAAHQNGYKAILAPAINLTRDMSCFQKTDTTWNNYLTDCDLPQVVAAADPDVYEIQSQKYQGTTSGTGCGCFAWFVTQAVDQAESTASIPQILAGLSTNYSGAESTPQTLYQDTQNTQGIVNGYWMNVPNESPNCPGCAVGGDPSVAAGLLWLMGYVGQGSQTISFSPASTVPAGTTTTLNATGGPSGSPVTFSVDPTSGAGVCNVSSGIVSFTAVGSCVLDANQAGTANFTAAPQVTATIAVSPGTQSIAFAPGTTGEVGGDASLNATGGASGNPVTFSPDPTSGAGVCAVSNTTVSFNAVGSCVLDANQAGTANFTAAPQVTATISIEPGTQAVTFSPPPTAVVGSTAALIATGGASGNPVTFSLDPTSVSGVCDVSGDSVRFNAVGSCVLDANQAGNAEYAPNEVTATVSVGQGVQAITFTAPSTSTVGGSANLIATGGASGNPVVFTLDPSSSPAVCEISGDTVSFTAVGPCVVDANETGSANYAAAPQVATTMTVGPGSQAISFVPPSQGQAGGSATLVSSGGGSGNPVAFSLDPSSGGGVCSLSGDMVDFAAVGSCVIDATQAGNANWEQAPEVVGTISVGQASQTITFQPPPSAPVGSSSTLAATGGGSGNPVAFSLDSSSGSGVCSLSGDTVDFTAVGSCVINATQAGSGNYGAAQTTATISVVQASQAITFDPPTTGTTGNSVVLTASGGNSGNPVTFSLDPTSETGICNVSDATISFTAVGSCVVDANQAGTPGYSAAPEVTATISVGLGSQTITFDPATSGAVGTSIALGATGGPSGNPITFALDASSPSGVCSVSGDTVTFDAVGTCLLDANESGNADYAAAPQVTASITVGQGSQMITFDPAPSATVGTTVALAASGGPSGNAVQWSTDPSTGPGVCAVSAGTVSFTAVGSCVIDANQVGSANYAAAPQVTATVTVGQSAQAISFSPALSGAVGNNVTLEATGGSSGNPVTFTVDPLSGPGVCGVTGPSGPTLSFTAVGSCVIDANQAGTANYNAAPQVVATVTVGPGSQSISFTTAPTAAVGQITTLAATGGASGDPVVFSLDPSSGSGVCAVSGPTLSFTAVGSCVIDANQAGTANYNAAPQITATVTVGPGSQSITVTSKPTRAVVGGPSYDFTATGGASGNPVVLTTLTPAVCTVSGSIVSFIGVGNCALRADQAGNSNYGAAPTRGQTFTVGPGSQKLTFTSKPPVKAVDGGPAYQFVVTGGPSGNPVTFTLTTPSVCALSGTSVSFVGLGTCTIDITQAGNADYKAAPPRTINIAVKSTSD